MATDQSTPRCRPLLGWQRGARRYGEDVIKVVLGLCALVSVLTTVGIVIALLVPAVQFFQEVPITEFIFGTDWAPLFLDASFGSVPLLVGHALDHVLGLRGGAAVRPRLRRSTSASTRARARARSSSPALELLAGIPTVVFGYFALTFFTPFLRDVGHLRRRRSTRSAPAS